ncbi:MAG: hypothetical protein [Bacteriophage sp.]|nr:MAG: hypothetical protein [Bacteriophage sp.]
MGKDTLQPTWVKKLSNIIMSMDTDSKGNVWVGSTTGTLTKFNGNGVASSPIKLDNPVYSVTVDKSTDDVYVGDSANNVYKYSSTGTLKWGKNLGVGNQANVPIVSTINGLDPDEKGNFDLTGTYYSQKQIEEMLAPLGKTKSVNGVKPDDAGNVVLDFSKYFTFKGTIDDNSNLDKNTDTGWYIKHNSNGQNSTFLVFSDKGSTMQIECGYDNSIKERSSNGNKFTDWTNLTNNIKSINGIKPDSEGNIKLDLTGNIKTVNNVKPDKNGNIQLGAGTKNSIKSINTVNKPDEFGNVQVPTFAPNLLQGTTIKKQSIPVNKDATANNIIASSDIASDSGYPALGGTVKDGGETSSGEKLLSDIAIKGGENYTYRVKASTTTDTLQLPGWSEYTQWRRADTAVYLTFKDKDDNLISVDRQELRYSFEPQDKEETHTFTDTFTAPANAVSFSLWYNGLEQTADNIVTEAYMVSSNSEQQVKDDRTFNAISPLPADTRIVARIECKVNNYKSGNFLTIKTKDLANHNFTLDESKLDSNSTTIASIESIDSNNLVEQDGFYTWDFVLNAGDIVGLSDKGKVTVSTNIVGTFKYVLKLAIWDAGRPEPDMEFVTTFRDSDKQNTTETCVANYNTIKFWDGALYNNKTVNRVELGSYNLDNDYIALDDTVGKYSASAHVDMGNSQGYANLVLMELSGNGVVNKAISESIPFKQLGQDGSVTKDASNTLKTDSITVSEPKDNYVIKLYLDIYGQTDVVNVSQQKLAQWKDNDETPPDLTWFPSAEDVLKVVKKINGKLPDGEGNFDLPSLENPDFSYVKGQTFDFDTALKPGIYNLMDVTVITSINKNALDNVSMNRDKTTLCGYLFVNQHDSWNVSQIILVFTGRYEEDVSIYTRGISAINNYRPIFRRLLHLDDIDNIKSDIHKEIVGLDALNANYGNNIYNTTVDLDKFNTNGLSKFLNCTIITKGAIHGHDVSTTGLYGWIADVPIWNGAEEVQQFVYIRDYGSGSLLYVRDRVHVGDNTDFEKFTTNKDVLSIVSPDTVYNYGSDLDVDTTITPGVYQLNDVTLSASINSTVVDSIPRNGDGKTVAGYFIVFAHDKYNVAQILITVDTNEQNFIVNYRLIVATNTYRPKFTTLPMSTLTTPIDIDNRTYSSLNKVVVPGIYRYLESSKDYKIIDGTPIDSKLGFAPAPDSRFFASNTWYLYVYDYSTTNELPVIGGSPSKLIMQELHQGANVWFRPLTQNPSIGIPYSNWLTPYGKEISDLNNKIADLEDKFPVSIMTGTGNKYVIESSINNRGKIVYW